MTSRFTVADVLDHADLAEADLVGGGRGTDRAVRTITLLTSQDVVDAEVPEGAFVVFSAEDVPHDRWLHRVDLLLRKADRAAGAAVLVHVADPHQFPMPLATTRLADRLGMPLIGWHHAGSVLPTTLALQRLVLAPEIERARTLLIASGIEDQASGPDLVVRRLERAVGGEAAVISRDHVVAGDVDPVALKWARARKQRATGTRAGLHVAAMPFGENPDAPEAWIVIARHGAGPAWANRALDAAAMCRGDVLTWLAGERVAAERAARSRGMLLAEILEHGDSLAGEVRVRAETAGWPLAGWHTGVHVRIDSGYLGGWAMASAVDALDAGGLHLGAFVERSDGWAGWATSDQAPSPTALRRLGRGLRSMADGIVAAHPTLRLSIGIGSPARDSVGISTTLAQARQAALVAASSGEQVAVRAVHDLGASRLLLGWYGSSAFRDLAEQILRPLIDSGEDELLVTLRAYLDRACSAAHTARVLGVHRNTVGQRITRIERILGASLTSPDTRLALQLALRAHAG